MPYNTLTRFIDAQERDYHNALTEIKNGRKRSHWIWYIFPQIQGLGYSETSNFYGIKNLDEARAYLEHPLLGKRLVEISLALLQLADKNANQVFGSPDDIKVRSCMTLFAMIEGADPVFEAVLKKYYNGEKDQQTVHIANSGR